MSPEQAHGRTPTYAADVYAMGCVLFELLAGTPVVTGNDVKEILRQHIYEPAPSLVRRAGRPFDPVIEGIVAQALAKEPLHRFASASEMANALRPFAVAPERGAAATGNTTAIDPVFSKPTARFDAVGAGSSAPTGTEGDLPAHAIATDSSVPRLEPSQATRLPDGVIDWSLSSQALAQELLTARTTAATQRRYPVVFTVVGLALGLSIGLAVVGIHALQKHEPSSSPSVIVGSTASASAMAESTSRPTASADDLPPVPTVTTMVRPAVTAPSHNARPVGGAASIAASSTSAASTSSAPVAVASATPPPPTTTTTAATAATATAAPTAPPATTGRPSRPVESDRAD